jgi:aspartate/methionine/tyrosine aminotransferase
VNLAALDASALVPRPELPPLPGIAGVQRSQLERWFSSCGRPPRLDLARSGAPGLTARQILGLAAPDDVEAYLDMSLDYGPGVGTERLRTAAAAVAGCSPEDVIITHGAIEALLLACAASLESRTTVAVASPGYEGLFRAVEAAGGVVQRVPVWSPGASGLDLARLLDLDLARYGAVVVNSPHNPTGLTAAVRDLADLAERCVAASTTLIVDQVSLGTLDPCARSVLRHAPASPAVVQVGDVSKAFGLGGLRVGWCAVPEPARRARIAELRDVTSLANSAPSQHLAAIALENGTALSAAPTAQSNLERLCALTETLAPSDRWSTPADGLVAFPPLPLVISARVFADRLRERFGVAVTPGSFFGYDRHLRVGLGLAPALFEEALDRLVCALDAGAGA